jgi:hypothetical protein
LGKKKRHRRKPMAASEKKNLIAEILIGVVSGIITAAIAKWLDW